MIDKGKGQFLRVAGDPTYISHASELVVGMNIKDELHGHRRTQKISTSSVNNTLWFPCRTRRLRYIVSTMIVG